jgi:hypothetical protein
LSDNVRFTGLDLSPDAQAIVIASGDTQGGTLVVASADKMVIQETITVPQGVVPVDPEYSPDGGQLLFAGVCSAKNPGCSDATMGWNIYTYDFNSKATHQITLPRAGFTRRGPAWGPGGRKYFVGFSQKFGGSSLVAANALFEISEDGEARPIFPRDSMSPKTDTIYHYLAKITSLSIVSVRKDGIIFKARIAAKQTRTPDDILRRFEKTSGVKFDSRLTQFADERIYTTPKEEFLSRETANTLFQLSNDRVEIFHEMEQVTGDLPERLSVHTATAERNRIWLWASTLDEKFQGKIIEFKGFNSEIIDPVEAEIHGKVVAFEMASESAVIAARHNDGGIRLYMFSDWVGQPAYLLKLPKNE